MAGTVIRCHFDVQQGLDIGLIIFTDHLLDGEKEPLHSPPLVGGIDAGQALFHGDDAKPVGVDRLVGQGHDQGEAHDDPHPEQAVSYPGYLALIVFDVFPEIGVEVQRKVHGHRRRRPYQPQEHGAEGFFLNHQLAAHNLPISAPLHGGGIPRHDQWLASASASKANILY